MKALLFVAHGDDDSNGFGGTLHILRRHNWDLYIVYATLPEGNARSQREGECLASASFVGAQPIIWGLPDGKLEASASTKALADKTFQDINPDLVLCLHGMDVHPDHRAISSLALGPAMQRGVNIECFSGEICSSGRHSVGNRPQTLGFAPTHYVDTSLIQDEVAGMTLCHQSQDPQAMIEGMGLVHQNRARELGKGATHAEAFIRMTRYGPLHKDLTEIFRASPFELPRLIGFDVVKESIGLK